MTSVPPPPGPNGADPDAGAPTPPPVPVPPTAPYPSTPVDQPSPPAPGQAHPYAPAAPNPYAPAPTPSSPYAPGPPAATPYAPGPPAHPYAPAPPAAAPYPPATPAQPSYAPGTYPAPPQQWAQAPGAAPQWGAPPTPKKSRGPLIALITVLVLVAAGAGAYFLFFAGGDATKLDKLAADVTETTQAQAQQLVVGNCLVDLPKGAVTEVTVVPCEDEHTAQVVASKKFSGENFPGSKKLVSQTTDTCPVDLNTEDVSESDVVFGFVVWTPSEDSWADGDRTGLCIATADTEYTGVVE